MTFINIVNTVLRQLRENEVSGIISNDYGQLIAQFVQQVLEEMEEAKDWARLYQSTTFTAGIGERIVDLTSGSADLTGSNYCTIDSRITYDSRKMPLVFDVTDTGEHTQLVQTDGNQHKKNSQLELEQTGKPSEFSLNPSYSEKFSMRFDTLMDKERNFRAFFYNPQASRLSITTNDDSATEIVLPQRAIIMGTLFYALNERGEELGEPGGIAERRWNNALAAAIEADQAINLEFMTVQFTNDELGGGGAYGFNQGWK